ncbi:hypothetical protein HZS_1389 [Henneguya salminicola]|nr:hypothetical protein HZS_1389 [Henneguya salminicola]
MLPRFFIELGVSVRLLPPYSSQLNPIEEYFSHLKSVYSSETGPRNNSELKEKILRILEEERIPFDDWWNHMRISIERETL